jgi:hypothetical protein
MARLNLDGLVTCDGGTNASNGAYTQIFRDGALEAVESAVVVSHEGRKVFAIDYIERELQRSLSAYLDGFKQIGVRTPICAFLSITDAKTPSP